MPRGQPSMESFKKKMLKGPMNIIRYLQQKVLVLQQERRNLLRENQRLATEHRANAAANIEKPLSHQDLLELNNRLIEKNQQLKAAVYNANQMVANKTRDIGYLYQVSAHQMQENFNLKIILHEQNKELWRVKNNGAPKNPAHAEGTVPTKSVEDEPSSLDAPHSHRNVGQLNPFERVLAGDFSAIQ